MVAKQTVYHIGKFHNGEWVLGRPYGTLTEATEALKTMRKNKVVLRGAAEGWSAEDVGLVKTTHTEI